MCVPQLCFVFVLGLIIVLPISFTEKYVDVVDEDFLIDANKSNKIHCLSIDMSNFGVEKSRIHIIKGNKTHSSIKFTEVHWVRPYSDSQGIVANFFLDYLLIQRYI